MSAERDPGREADPGARDSQGEAALHARLRRLRREHSPAPPEARAEPPLPNWLRGRLARSGAPGALDAGTDPGSSDTTRATLGPPGALEEHTNARGCFGLRRSRPPRDARHGGWSLDEITHADPRALAWLAKDPALATIQLERAVYLDIETTGLSGGAGTVPFLVALARFEGEVFELWQGFLRGPEEEPALLEAVAERVRGAEAVVSFFGKSFDRHRLEDKMRIHGIAPPFAGRPHLDLYHPLRRLYRESLPDGRLQTMERALCGVLRSDDLPGSRAPAAWFDFLAGRAHRLEDVFRHNADDVLSLAVLAAHLGRTLTEARADGDALAGCATARARGVARTLDAVRERAQALAWAERALERAGGEADATFLAFTERLRRGLRRQARRDPGDTP